MQLIFKVPALVFNSFSNLPSKSMAVTEKPAWASGIDWNPHPAPKSIAKPER